MVTYKVRNTSGQVFGDGSPAWLAILDPTGRGEFQEDQTNSVIPGSLQPGEWGFEAVSFATRTPTGIFTLRTNDSSNRSSQTARCGRHSSSPRIRPSSETPGA